MLDTPQWSLGDAADGPLLAAIFETAGNVILGLHLDHRIFAGNRAAEELYQTPRSQALGQDDVATCIAPEHRAAVAADIQAAIGGKPTLNYEDDSILPDGQRRTLLWNVTRVLDKTDAPVGIVAVGRDITARKEAEERFRLVFEYADVYRGRGRCGARVVNTERSGHRCRHGRSHSAAHLRAVLHHKIDGTRHRPWALRGVRRDHTVQVESVLGQSTTMRVTLPLSTTTPDVAGSASDGAAAVAAVVTGVLLLKDDAAVRSTTRRLLERHGWRVLEAGDGMTALAQFMAHRDDIAIVLTDVRMPVMDGVQLALRIRRVAVDFPIVFFSGYDELEQQSVQGISNIPLIAKPFGMNELLRVLAATLAAVRERPRTR